MRRTTTLTGIIFGLTVASATAFGGNLKERCDRDKLTSHGAGKGRNAWMEKCGYINKKQEASANSLGFYWVFTDGGAPTDPSKACQSGRTVFSMCPVGCYTADQELLFDNKWIPIAEAYAEDQSTVTSLTRKASQTAPSFGEQKLHSFVVGDAEEDIYVITTEDGHEVEVTPNHPLVTKAGVMKTAKALRKGDELMGIDGGTHEVVSIGQRAYEGKVWNVLPLTQNRKENVVAAEGLLTGSIRYQNQWAGRKFRLFQRASLDVSDL